MIRYDKVKYVNFGLKNGAIALILFVSCIMIGCGTSVEKKQDNFSDCKYGAPKAIFSATYPEIKTHSFKVFNNEGIELIHLNNGVVMELIQSGCDQITQSFKFRLPGDHRQKNALNWVEEAVIQLRYLGGLDEKFASLSFWGNEIEQRKSEIKLGALHDIQQGFKVKIDKVLSTNESILLCELSQ